MARSLYKIDHDAAVRNVHAWLALADASAVRTGSVWYPNARREAVAMADAARVDVAVAASVISHLSPQTRYDDNLRMAWHTLTADGRPSGCLGDNYRRALRALHSDTPLDTFGKRAHKTAAFARAILGDTDAVVIDTWAVRVALIHPDDGRGFRDGSVDAFGALLKRVSVYGQIADAYREAAAMVKLPGTALQAITWGVIRGGYE